MDAEIPGFVTPVHRALTEPILMGGAPRSIAIVNGTLAAALGIGLRLWVAVSSSGSSATWSPSGPPSAIPEFVEVVRRHLRIPGHLNP